MRNMTLINMAEACGGRLVLPREWGESGEAYPSGHAGAVEAGASSDDGPAAVLAAEAAGVVLDSRQVEKGFVFIAARGERVDGHRFIPEVFEKGALGVVCEKLPEDAAGPCILVEDSFRALQRIGEFYRCQLPVTVVGITGSVGKTSTKEFIASVLAQRFHVHKTQGNYNNEVGVPLTVLSMPEDTQTAVLEMGINHFGEMSRLSRIARPDICVMTNIGQCHLEFLGSRQGILKAKSEIFDFMKEDGFVCVNGDDDMLSSIREVKGRRPVSFGLDGRAENDLYATDIKSLGLLGSEAVIHVRPGFFSRDISSAASLFDREKEKEEWSFPVRIPLPGGHMVYNALAAAAVGLHLGLTAEEIAEGIARVEGVSGRSHIVKAGDKLLIDDCYNANPVSMEAAIDLLGQAEGRRVAVLGDMFELGKEERALHARVGRYATEHGVDCLICVGELSRSMYEEAQRAGGLGGLVYFPDRESLLQELESLLLPGDTVLIKASHGMGFERVVERLSAHPL